MDTIDLPGSEVGPTAGPEGPARVSPGPGSSIPPRPPVWVGTAGFSYPDWERPVYADAPRAGPSRLAWLSAYVDLLEANVSFYRIPAEATALSWLRAVERPEFRFTAKVWRGFTHGPETPSRTDLAAQRAFLAALGSDGRLLAALAQFPPSFRAGERTRDYVTRLAAHLEGFPLAVEMRHASWDRDDLREAMREAGIAWVNPDLPPEAGALPPAAHVTAGIGYVRLHGRNPAWGRPGVGRDAVYDWLYAADELAPWLARIEAMRGRAAGVVVVANNHYGGKAVANALQVRSALRGERVPVPASLLAAFPALADVAARVDGGRPSA